MADSTVKSTTSQHLRDLKLALEYKYLMKYGPSGIYLVPEFDNIRSFHGVIFLRKGLYRNGIFRFTLALPPTYNSANSHPIITFYPPIFHPLIDSTTGLVDLRCDPSLQEWSADKQYMITALLFIKKIFYVKSYEQYSKIANEEALKLYVICCLQYYKYF